MEKISYGGWRNCLRLSNGSMELVVTADVGPRIIRCGFAGEQNLFKEYGAAMGGQEWRIYGGHRLWHAPEEKPRTYAPDNDPIKYEWDGAVLRLFQPVETLTGIEKQIEITLDPSANSAVVRHRLINRNLWDIRTACWCLSVMAPGGRAVLPQEPFVPFPDQLLPARPMVMWSYTDMADKRWNWGSRYIQLSQDSEATYPQKLGLRNSVGWGAYLLKGDVFLKTTSLDKRAEYPDFGSNWEIYTNSDMLELETLGPLQAVQPGQALEHVETWNLFKANVSPDEKAIDQHLLPLATQALARRAM